MDLKGKIVLITGGAGLLGSEFCNAVIKNNGLAIIADNNIKAAELLARKLNKYNKGGFSYYLDINNPSSIDDLILKLHRKFGKIDALVNNAYPRNKSFGRHFLDVEYEDFCENISMHLGGYFIMSQRIVKYFINQGYGNIINMGSIYGVSAPKFEIYEGTNMTMAVEYAFIKSGIIHFTKYLSTYLKGKNIRVNAISPGGIKDKQPTAFLANYREKCLNKGMLDASDLSGTLLYLLSDSSLNVNGQNIIVDDGFTL